MDLSPSSVVSYYLGSEEEFMPARTYQSMLEVAHSHLPMMALVLLLLTHLVLFAPFSRQAKTAFVVVPFVAALLNEGSSWLVRFVDPGFALVKVASFVALQGSLIVLLAALGVFLARSRNSSQPARDTDTVIPGTGPGQGSDRPLERVSSVLNSLSLRPRQILRSVALSSYRNRQNLK
jgi:hypothetical protein